MLNEKLWAFVYIQYMTAGQCRAQKITNIDLYAFWLSDPIVSSKFMAENRNLEKSNKTYKCLLDVMAHYRSP